VLRPLHLSKAVRAALREPRRRLTELGDGGRQGSYRRKLVTEEIRRRLEFEAR
jgi:hypothetical protein